MGGWVRLCRYGAVHLVLQVGGHREHRHPEGEGLALRQQKGPQRHRPVGGGERPQIQAVILLLVLHFAQLLTLGVIQRPFFPKLRHGTHPSAPPACRRRFIWPQYNKWSQKWLRVVQISLTPQVDDSVIDSAAIDLTPKQDTIRIVDLSRGIPEIYTLLTQRDLIQSHPNTARGMIGVNSRRGLFFPSIICKVWGLRV